MAVLRDDARATLAPQSTGTSASFAAEPTSERPTQVDRYEIRHELGRGAMGSVFAAWDPKLRREVAVKLVATQQRNNSKGRARFLREARAVAAIGQANVVQIFDYSGLESDMLYLVMEKLEGRDLWELMHTHRQFPEAIAALIGHELCLALEAAHQVGIIHRDLKPENVFVTHAGRVVLTDFGIVKAIADDAPVEGYTERTEVIGTPGFMAPELMRGKSLTPMTDVFALGALLYNVVTMQMPYEGQTPVALLQAAQRNEYVDPRRFQPSLSQAFCALIKRCLQSQPSARPQSAEEVRHALRAILDDLAEHAFGDDLLAWLHEPAAFAAESHARTAAHLIDQMTLAVVHNNQDQAVSLKDRLLALDPFNEAWRPVFAQLGQPGAGEHVPARPPPDALLVTAPALRFVPSNGARNTRLGRVLSLCVMLLCCAGVFAIDRLMTTEQAASDSVAAPGTGGEQVAQAGLGAMRAPAVAEAQVARPTVAAAAAPSAEEPATKPPAQSTQQASELQLDVAGRGAWLIVDGHGVGHVRHESLQLAAGRHRIVLLRRSLPPVRRWLELAPGQVESWRIGDGATEGAAAPSAS